MPARIPHRFIDDVEVKRCGVCGQWLPLGEFGPCRSKWDGLYSRCKPCDAAIGAKYRAENSEKIRAYDAHRRELKRGGPAMTRELPKGQAMFNRLLRNYRNGAKHRNLEFSLSDEMFMVITKQSCYYCGIEPQQVWHREGCNGDYVYNGIDRVDNNLGYVPGNVVACCWRCNEMKKDMSQKEFLEHCKAIAERHT